MMAAWLSFIAAFAGFGLLSLAMQRHAQALSVVSPRWTGRQGKALLRTLGAAALIASAIIAMRDNPQLGAIFWSGYAMAAMLLVSGLHAYAERRAARSIGLASALLVGSALAIWWGVV